MTYDMQALRSRLRFRLDDLEVGNEEFDDDFIDSHLTHNLEIYDWELPLEKGRDAQLIVVEALIDIITSIKFWADGESYSYKNDAIQVTRGLMSKHFQDTIKILKEERNDLISMDGGFA